MRAASLRIWLSKLEVSTVGSRAPSIVVNTDQLLLHSWLPDTWVMDQQKHSKSSRLPRQ